jgi:RNA polymerase sigma factor (sigma-70 family)
MAHQFDEESIQTITVVVAQRNSWASAAQVADAVADALERFVVRPGTFTDEADNATGWLIRVASNRLYDEFRRTRRFTDLTPDNDSISHDGGTEAGAEFANSWKLVQYHLAPVMAEAIWMRFIEQWKLSEIAEKQGRSVNAVKISLKRGRLILRTVLKDEHTELRPPLKRNKK